MRTIGTRASLLVRLTRLAGTSSDTLSPVLFTTHPKLKLLLL